MNETQTMSKRMVQERLIVALDVPRAEEARSLVQDLQGTVSFFKVGWELFLATGLSFVQELKNQGHRVFLDLKLPDDIDETIKRAVTQAVRADVDFLTLHGNAHTIRVAKEAKGRSNLQLLAVTVLSSMDERDLYNTLFMSESQFKQTFGTMESYIVERAKKCLESGSDGLIATGQDARALRSKISTTFTLVCPGVRPAGHSSQDHKRVATPEEAMTNGADYLVVGRPIRDAKDRKEAALQIIVAMEVGLSTGLSS